MRDTVPTRYWRSLADGRVQCDVCPRHCRLSEGARGLCFVRARRARRNRAHDLWPLVRLLRRPDREEAAQSFPARNVGAVVRHGRLQPHLQVLPELGHLEIARDRHAGRQRVARDTIARAARRGRLPLGRVHLQRPGHLHGICNRRGAGLPRGRRQDRGGDGRLYLARSRASSSSATWTPPTSTSRASPRSFLPQALHRKLAAVLETLEYIRHETDCWLEITTLLIPG